MDSHPRLRFRKKHLWKHICERELQAQTSGPRVGQYGERRARHQRLSVLHHVSQSAVAGRETRGLRQSLGGDGMIYDFRREFTAQCHGMWQILDE